MKKKYVVIAGVVVGLLLLYRIAVLVFSSAKETAPRGGQMAIAVEIDSIRYEPIQEIRRFSGSVHPIYQYIVAPKVSGRLLRINKRIGDWVRSGEMIALIDDAEYQQAVREAEANLRIAESSLLEARSQFSLATQEQERATQLQQKGIASSAELDAANTNFIAQQSRLELAQAQVEQRQAALKSAQIRLSYTTLTVDQPGFIGERYVDEGALLSPNAPVVSVVGIDRVIVRTTIIEKDYGRIVTGQTASVQVDAYASEAFPGLVARIAPVLDEASRVAKMEVEVDNSSRILKPGMFAKVSVVLSHTDDAQIVPSKAIIGKNGTSHLYLVDMEKRAAREVPVTVGIVNGEKTEIVAPRLDGYVVTLGQHLLQDGTPVILPSVRQPESAGSAKNKN